MNIYAIKDRLIGYFLVPFAAHTDREVLAAIAAAINSETNTDAIAQAPHHFEVWRLAEVDDQGHITQNREFIQDCAGLIRDRVRKDAHSERRSHQGGQTAGGELQPPPAAPGRRNAAEPPPGQPSQATDLA